MDEYDLVSDDDIRKTKEINYRLGIGLEAYRFRPSVVGDAILKKWDFTPGVFLLKHKMFLQAIICHILAYEWRHSRSNEIIKYIKIKLGIRI